MSRSFLLVIGCFSLAACDAQPSGKTSAATESTPAAQTAAAATQTASAPPASQQAAPASPYRLLGILDPERNQMAAFALKVPRDWQVQQSFKRQWEGAVAHNLIYINLRSPDGHSQIEYLPAAQYIYAEGPLSDEVRAQQRSLGMPVQAAANELQPMQPVAYIKEKLLSYLAQNGLALSGVGNEQTAPQTTDENQRINLRGSVDGTLPNGNKARVECRIGLSSQQINGDTYYSWGVVPSITQTDGDLEMVHAHTRIAQDSIVVNPAWRQIEQEAQNRGSLANSEASRQQHEATMGQINSNTAAMTRGHEQRMNNIRQFGEANTARFNERMTQMDRNKAAFDGRMADQDRQQRIRIDTIRGESKYADPNTGQRVTVEDGFNHVYQNGQDPQVTYGTNTPIDAGTLDWQELQKVELKDY